MLIIQVIFVSVSAVASCTDEVLEENVLPVYPLPPFSFQTLAWFVATPDRVTFARNLSSLKHNKQNFVFLNAILTATLHTERAPVSSKTCIPAPSDIPLVHDDLCSLWYQIATSGPNFNTICACKSVGVVTLLHSHSAHIPQHPAERPLQIGVLLWMYSATFSWHTSSALMVDLHILL